MPVDDAIAVCCGIALVLYELINPNMDAEREMLDRGDKVTYYVTKYSKWLLVFVGGYCALRVLSRFLS